MIGQLVHFKLEKQFGSISPINLQKKKKMTSTTNSKSFNNDEIQEELIEEESTQNKRNSSQVDLRNSAGLQTDGKSFINI